MSMTISSLVSSALLGGVYGNSTTPATRTDPVSQAFSSANVRIAQQLSSTNVQVSAFGQIKSGFASLQTAGDALSALGKSTTSADVKKSAQAFVDAFNTAGRAVSSAANTGTTASALANDGRASVAANDLRKVLTNGSTTADLRKIGISVNNDGSLSLDAKAFDAATTNDLSAVRGALAKIGSQASNVSAKELTGNVGAAVAALDARVKSLTSQQTAYGDAASSILTAQQQYSNLSSSASSGISAYLSIFSS